MSKRNNLRKIYAALINKFKSQTTEEVDYKKLKKEYEAEEDLKAIKLFSGGSVGVAIGLAICILTILTGAQVSPPEIIAIVGGLALLGAVTGYIVF